MCVGEACFVDNFLSLRWIACGYEYPELDRREWYTVMKMNGSRNRGRGKRGMEWIRLSSGGPTLLSHEGKAGGPAPAPKLQNRSCISIATTSHQDSPRFKYIFTLG